MEEAGAENDETVRYDPIFNTPLKKLCRAVREEMSAETLDAAAEEALMCFGASMVREMGAEALLEETRKGSRGD